jgi:hypothetical protein
MLLKAHEEWLLPRCLLLPPLLGRAVEAEADKRGDFANAVSFAVKRQRAVRSNTSYEADVRIDFE